VHPDDERYASLVANKRRVRLPLTGREIPIIADDYVDREFGTGVVKVTPAHDFNDYQVGVRHSLPILNIFTDDAKIIKENELQLRLAKDSKVQTFIAPGLHFVRVLPEKFEGLDRYEARKAIVADLEAQGLLIETKPHKLQVPRGDRTGQVIEPYLTDQWFVRMDGLAKRGMELVENGEIRFVPPNWISTYRHWLENIQDWCISRQLWWGHRIPAWYDAAGNVHVGRDEADARARAGLAADVVLRQDSDVLETWFSSGIWPISTMGWPDAAAMDERGFRDFVPSSVLVTGFDIIFFWVARMIMMTDALTGKVPFKDVYITGLVRDKDGLKMSKAKGNILDPLDLIDGIELDALVAKRTARLMKPQDAPKIEKATRKEFPDGIPAFGADALRFTMAALAGPGRDIKFDLARCEGYKNFCNKLWNATRFVLLHTENFSLLPPAGEGARRADEGNRDANASDRNVPTPVTDAERWILARLAKASAEAEAHFAAYRFDLLAQALYEFAWNEFCDWFLEFAKPALSGDDAAAADSTRHTLLFALERLLRLLHPLIPFVTEELWRQIAPRLGVDGDSIVAQRYPQPGDADGGDAELARAEADVEWLKAMVSALRRVRSELQVPPKQFVPLLLQGGTREDAARVARFATQLKSLVRLDRIDAVAGDAPPAATAVVGELTLLVPLAGLVDLDAERARLDKEIARIAVEIEKSEAKLAKFSDKVPAAVIEQERQRLADWRAKFETLSAQRAKLGA